MKHIYSQLPQLTPSTSVSKRARAAAGVQSLPQELIDGVIDMAVHNHVPYKEVAAVSSAFRQTALSHARRALMTAPQHVANGAPCLSQQDWLQLSQAYRWLQTMGTDIEAPQDQLERVGPEALRASLEPWVATQPDAELATEAASRMVEAYRLGAPTLDLSDLELTTLPDSIGQLKALQNLDVDHNQLTTLPDSIGQLKALQNLDVDHNQLTTLPDSIGQLTALQSLDINYNQLTTLPDSIGQLKDLQRLDVDHNQLTTLPDSIGQLTALQSLDIKYNQLPTLPDSIGQLTALQKLDVVHNLLTTLPDSIGQLKDLQGLNVALNQLMTLPDSIGQLTALRWLDVRHNPLEALPDMIKQRRERGLRVIV